MLLNYLMLDIINQLSPDAFAYFFPGAKQPGRCIESPEFDCISPTMSSSETCYDAEYHYAEAVEVIRPMKCLAAALDDEQLDPKTMALLDEIKALQEKYGVTIDELEAVLSYTVKLSRLRITRRHEIILEDFDQREVKMDTLTKAVFLLYLNHPEGIRYKDLGDHRKELEDIYMSISGRSDLPGMKKSLDDLTHSVMSNSISEKVSKARRAFREVVDERVARFYYIDGKSGEAKKIAFDRSLVIRD